MANSVKDSMVLADESFGICDCCREETDVRFRRPQPEIPAEEAEQASAWLCADCAGCEGVWDAGTFYGEHHPDGGPPAGSAAATAFAQLVRTDAGQ